MQNRGALWIFTILLALACLWQLSFSFFTSGLERRAVADAELRADSTLAVPGNERLDRDSLKIVFENRFLRENSEERIYPVFGYTYRECKEKEINLGLDLKGGMAVTLEVSIPELIENLSENSSDATFKAAMAAARERQRSSDADFITLFGEEWKRSDPNARLAAVFHSADKKDMFPREASNDEILAALKREAEAAINNTERIMRTRIDKFGVAQPSIQKQQFSGRIQIELPGVKDKERVRKVLQSTANLEFWETYDNATVYPMLEAANTRLAEVRGVRKPAADTTAAPVTEEAVTEARDTSVVQDSVAGEDLLKSLSADSAQADTAAQDFSRENPLFAVLTPSVFSQGGGYRLAQGSAVGNARISDTADVALTLRDPALRDVFPTDLRFAWSAKPIEGTDVLTLYALKVPRGGKPKLDGSVITSASQDFDMKGDVEVRMQMNAEGAQTWKVMTGDNVGKAVAIVLDELVYSAPTVITEIAGGRSSISMGSGDLNQQIQEAEDLANILKAGALPAPARIIDETVVGPSLGQENIDRGMWSFLLALLLVMLYMFLYYSGAGLVADVVLIVNLFVLLGSLASLQAALTLPGIAGIVLTMGMAVDANVLIYERVREELRAGKMLKSAVDLGYKGAMSAIIDSNVTTFITAAILYLFGSGPIRGFATTLGLGILTSLFTALFLSRMIITRRLELGKQLSFWMAWSKDLLMDVKVDWMSRRRIFYIISAVIIGVGVFSMVTRGFNLGVDFSGGRSYVVKFDKEINVEQVRAAVDGSINTDGGQATVNVKSYGGSRQVKITTNYLVNESGTEVDGRVEERLRAGLDGVGGAYDVVESRKVDPTISDDIKTGAFWSITLALIAIFGYIAVRFRSWQYGVGALFALAHDALFVLGLYSLLNGVVGFSLEIDEAFIAVVLTVIGYSVNDTVVVFDRIREYLAEHKRDTNIAVFNKGINATLGRTLNTGVTTLLVLIVIFFLGAVSIKGFVFGLFMGILVGTYSSIFVASAITVDLLKEREGTVAKSPVAA